MRVIRLTTDKNVDAIERELINAIQFFFGWHLGNVTFEIDAKVEKGRNTIYIVRYVYNTKRGRKTGKLPRIVLYQPSKGEFVAVLPDEPVLVTAVAHGLSQIADSLDVNIGNYNHVANTVVNGGKQIEANPVTVNTAVNSAITSLLIDKKLKPSVFAVPLTYGFYIVVFGTRDADNPLDAFTVELELIVDEDIVEVGTDAGGHSKHIKAGREELITVGEEFVFVGNTFEIEKRLEKRLKR